MKIDSVRKSLLESGLVGRICRAFGVNVRQYRLLVDLFSTLGDRMEFMGARVNYYRVIGLFYAFSALVSLVAFAQPPLATYTGLMLGINMFYLLSIILNEAAQSIMNPDEASILAHQPIRGATYVAAKITHVLWLVAVFVPAFSLVPALAGLLLHDSRWFFPLAHMAAAYLSGLFIASLVCGIYGWLFMLISPARLKSASLWLQFMVFVMLGAVNPMAPHIAQGGAFGWFHSSWTPWRWFTAVALLGCGASVASAWEAWAAFGLTAAFLAFGFRGFRADYLAKASDLVQGSAARSRAGSGRKLLSRVVSAIAGAPSGYGAFSFMYIMVRRDWNFRRQGLPLLLYLAFLAFPLSRGIRVSPFVEGTFSIRSFSLMHLIPHVMGLMLALISAVVLYTAEPKGPAMFATLPVGRLGPFVRGVYFALWFPAAFLHLLLVGPCVWFWGVAHGILFVSFSLSLVSLYLSLTVFFIEGLPFSAKFKPSLASEQQSIVLFAAVPILIIAVLQWLLFYNIYWVLVATIVLAALAWGVGRFSLGALEGKVRASLAQLSFGTQQIFTESG